MYTELIKIIEGGIIGDKEKVYNYAKVLADNLEKAGDLQLSKKIRSTLTNKKGNLVTLDEFASKPVDQESRMDMVMIDFPPETFQEFILSNHLEKEIANFIKVFECRNDLLKAGVDNFSSLLLYGPPGCGKTTLAKYISFKTGLPLVTAKLDALVSSLLGSTSKNIRKIFDFASKRQCILFLDEFDVIAKVRDDQHELGELKRVVNTLLQNIDSFNSDSILIAATNHDKLLDPAVWRRFSKVISLDVPAQEEVKFLIKTLFQNVNTTFLDTEKKVEQLSLTFENLSHSDIKAIIQNTIKRFIINKNEVINSIDVLYETFLFKNHNIENEQELTNFLYKNGMTLKEISETLNIDSRKVSKLVKQTL